ncbi:laccase-14 [Quercus suber]|uniref:Laccase n=1 Tax=Quercus suber TaxID=58331 RepID=A0AAW0L160_QUESU
MGAKKVVLILAFLGFWYLDGLPLCTASVVHNYTYILKETNFTRLCSTKSMLTVNGQFPGPVLRVQKADEHFFFIFKNRHGVKQPRNPWSDGPENITQCPIKPGKKFTYEVVFSDEEGTLWWHAHSDWSRATVHGAIVISPKNGTSYPFPKPYAEEVIILGEWYKGDVKELIDNATATGADPEVSDAYTLNGQPGYPNNCSIVIQGKTYLLRLIHAGMNEEMFFAIAHHKLTVVAQDASYLKPINTSYVLITPGQTMDILVTANQSPSHYYIAARPFFESTAPFDNSTTTAILQYAGNYTPPSSPSFPTTLPNITDSFAVDNFTTRVRALASKDHPISVPTGVDVRMFITVSVNHLPCDRAVCGGPNNSILAASLNNISFSAPKIDILQAYYRNLSNVYESNFPDRPPSLFNFTGDNDDLLLTSTGTKAKIIEYGKRVEIVFQGTSIELPENHPMHLHGFSFYLLGTGYGNFNKTTSPKTYNLIDPPEINTFGIPKNGWATIRFVANNPGVWFMHCHLERHSSWGMTTVIIVKNGTTNATSIRPPPANLPICS